ncbi:putative quinol monooxygenase [Bosea sp. (in: a-proteobacteria)]|uniref:putative quinol monooxygenase n=1 Tax=Bosea sp. (in: a-proteobacteria) TaxID=1871050 RepID=UPI002621668D|nr:antibiotic biosynthesis monooxygenase family protein [Bosea sp. (in: a-proteobacteria)]MCO5089642.1 antibiotic biosynthesis monooxygenase [Bosea sp. (in: a-proteobacteria)]
MQTALPLELAQIDVLPSMEEAFCRELSELLPLIAAAEGCHGVAAYRSVEHPRRFRLMVNWSSIEDHIAFRSTEAVQRIRSVIGRYVQSRAETEHLLQIATVRASQP